MRATRTAAVAMTAAAATMMTAATGCYDTTAIPPAQLASLQHPLDAPTALGDGTRLGPRTEIRARLTDGSVTTWCPAGQLVVGKAGLVTGRRYPLGDATETVLFDAAEGAEQMLAAMAPPGSEITPFADRLRLRVRDPRLLLPWIAAYADGASALRLRSGTLSFRGDRGAWASTRLPATTFAGITPVALAGVQIAEGIPWSDVAGLELHNLDTVRTTGAILGAPIAAALMVVATVGTMAAVAEGHNPNPSMALGMDVAATVDAASDDPDDTGDVPVRAPGPWPAVVVASDADGPTAAFGTTPLFSAGARRRDTFKLVLAGEAGATTDGAFTSGAGAGVRFADFIELTARMRTLAFDDAPLLAGGGAPAAAPPQHLLFGGRLAFHIDTDGDPRTAFVLGGEVLGGRLSDGASLTELGLVLGPRFGIGNKMFASLLFAPSLLLDRGHADRPDNTTPRLMITAELGFGL